MYFSHMKSVDNYREKLKVKKAESESIRLILQYKKNYHSPNQLKIYRKRRAELNKEIKVLETQIEIYG